MIQDKLFSPIFVTGIERSGSSIIARIINASGAYAGNVTVMQENINIRKLVDNYFASMGFDSKGQFPIPSTKELLIPSNWGENVINSLSLGNESKYWMFKSSRIAQTWPIWNFAFPNAKYIIVRRRTGDIISSCMKTAYMTAFKSKAVQYVVGASNEQEGWLWWVHEHEKKFVEMIEAGLNCKVVWPERMASGDFGQIYEMLKWLDLPWDNNIPAMVTPLFDHSLQREGRK